MSVFKRLFGKGDEESGTKRAGGISKEETLGAYIVREHKSGRSVDEILEDPYLKNRTSDEQRLRLLERPEVIRAIGDDTAAMARDRARGA